MNMKAGSKVICKRNRTFDEIVRDFWKRVDVRGHDDCWNWLKGKTSKGFYGYGVFWANGKIYKSHVFALSLNIPNNKKLWCCHTCDNPACCNPAHLYWGTSKDNWRDCHNRKRINLEKGEDRYNAKLTEESVKEIRSKYVYKKNGIDTLAKQYGVSRSMIYSIIIRKRWKHVL